MHEVSRVFRLGKITVGDGYVQYENRTAFGRVEVNKETEERYRRFLKMWQGNRQGGGGNDLVFLSGLFTSKTGKSMVGYIKKEEFNTIFKLMQECHEKGVDLMMIVSGPGDKGGNLAGRLSAAVGRPRQPQGQQGGFFGQTQAPTGPFGGPTQQTPMQAPSQIPVGPFAASAQAPQTGPAFQFQAPVATGGNIGGQTANNPPKDELESFLEGFDK